MSKSTDNLNEQLLPESWKRILQENFTTFRDHLRVREVVPHMYSALAITEPQKQEISACPTEYSKVDYVVNTVVRRGTKFTLAAFKNALKATDQSHLIPYLPAETPFDKKIDGVASAAIAFQDGEAYGESMDVSEAQQVQIESSNVTSGAAPQADPSVSQPADSTTGDSVYSHYSTPQPCVDQEIYGDLEKYSRIPGKSALCVLIGQFAAEVAHEGDASLPGYIKDMRDLESKFFGMSYNVEKYTNLTKDGFVQAIVDVQSRLLTGRYDRLVFIVLSHGLQQGVLTCENRQGHTAEIEQSSLQRASIPFRYIVEEFLPNKIPQLKGQPKFFIFQCCRGTQIVRGAADMMSPAFSMNDCIFGVDCDVLMSFSSVDETQAFVDQRAGSWYIQSLLKALERRDPRNTEMKHILSLVNDYVSKKKHVQDHLPVGSPDRTYRQTSIEYSTLRKLFYLHDPHI